MNSGAKLGGQFRPDIAGMRAVAVLAVVLYHAHVSLFRGGFVGVDVFYVISGFLITGLLWRELDRDHRLSFRSFYGRRIRRLLPMSILVIVLTAIASAIVLPPLQAHSALKDGAAAAGYVSNYRFAAVQTNYLTSNLPPSPFQQYWSLSLEEQFYLVWPILLFGVAALWRRRPSRRSAITALAIIAISSFLFGVWLTGRAEPWAFFSLPSRAWELAIGGLVAFASQRLKTMPSLTASILGWLGLLAVLLSAILLSGTVPYPGFAALAPVLGTAAVIAAGCSSPTRGPEAALGRAIPQELGRVSYSWYLWHWPVLVLVPAAIGHSLPLTANLGLATASLLIAVVSYRMIEDPLRRSAWLQAKPWRTLQVGGGLTLATLSVCAVCAVTLPTLNGHGNAPVADLSATGSGSFSNELTSRTAAVHKAVGRSLSKRVVPANLVPPLSSASNDLPKVFFNGCQDYFTVTTLLPCRSAKVSSHSSIVLFGDSHASMWYPAVDAAATKLGVRLVTWAKDACPPILAPSYSTVLQRTYSECYTWRQNVLMGIAKLHPKLVILGVDRFYSAQYGAASYSPEWIKGLSAMVRSIRHLGPRVLVIGPTPEPLGDVPTCLSAHLDATNACTIPLSQGLNKKGESAEARAVNKAGGTYFETINLFCNPKKCPTIVDNLLVFRDDGHITATYSSFLSPVITAELGVVLGRTS